MKCVAASTFFGCLVLGAFPALANDLCDSSSGIPLSATSDAPWAIHVLLKTKKIPLNAPLDAVITVCSGQETPPAQVAVDAIMPAHNHGMNYEPQLDQIGDYQYEVKNLVFHMPGIWRIEVTAFEGKNPHRYMYDLPVQ